MFSLFCQVSVFYGLSLLSYITLKSPPHIERWIVLSILQGYFCALPHLTLDQENIGILSLIRLSQKKTHAFDANTLGIKKKMESHCSNIEFFMSEGDSIRDSMITY